MSVCEIVQVDKLVYLQGYLVDKKEFMQGNGGNVDFSLLICGEKN